jgi:hypothetical protein
MISHILIGYPKNLVDLTLGLIFRASFHERKASICSLVGVLGDTKMTTLGGGLMQLVVGASRTPA